MSQLIKGVATCPRCAASWDTPLFSSVDADTIDAQVDAILAGEFERKTCSCGHAFRPEHAMLFASHERKLWIVMQPPADRAEFAAIERSVAEVIAGNIAQAAPAAAERLRGIRPRLVFGQHMLTEAVRAAYAGMRASLLECAKLLAVRRNLAALMVHGPFELCFERFERRDLVCAIHALPGAERVGELVIGADLLDEVRGNEAALRDRFPALFEQPYISASRYLLADTV